jgi:hypothetical protein
MEIQIKINPEKKQKNWLEPVFFCFFSIDLFLSSFSRIESENSKQNRKNWKI